MSHGLFSIFCRVPPGYPANDLICPILMARGEADVLGEAAVATYRYDRASSSCLFGRGTCVRPAAAAEPATEDVLMSNVVGESPRQGRSKSRHILVHVPPAKGWVWWLSTKGRAV